MVRQIQPRDLAEKLAAGEPVLLVDVRQPWEHEAVALPGSILIPLPQLADRAEEIPADPQTLVVAYCHHGIRSLSAAALLERLGCPHVASLAGGIDAWSTDVDPCLPRY